MSEYLAEHNGLILSHTPTPLCCYRIEGRDINSLVACKSNFYETAIDELMRGEGDNPTVGLLICKSTDKTVVEWSLRDINKPLGVSTYQLEEVVERTVKELEERKKEGVRK